MIKVEDGICFLATENTSYVFQITETGHLEHLYYGRRIAVDDKESATVLEDETDCIRGNVNGYSDEKRFFSLEDYRLEFSSYGKGDIREPFVEITHEDGSITSDFLFDSYQISECKDEYETMPGSYSEDGRVEHLAIVVKDRSYPVALELHYYVYEEEDVICRSSKVINLGESQITLNRLLSTQVDFDDAEYTMTCFQGAWAREMNRVDTRIMGGRFVNASFTGTSSSRANPFVILQRPETSEDFGECYGFNLIYSGNHYEVTEVNSFQKLRFVSGINPQCFSYILKQGDSFEAPEAVMSFSADGLNGLSQNMHSFVREHIVRGEWKKKIRPILLNSWEAAYFDINEEKLLKLAKAGKEVGIELFVMDDGWFGKRDDDTCSLGDWEVNRRKLPGGLEQLAAKINELGLAFGLWVEPEMVNVDSNLYRAHPEWTIEVPGKPHSEGRNQRILDVGNPDVQEYIIQEMTKICSSANISYIKWDMNRVFSDYYSQVLPTDRQGEVAHRYVVGFYHCMKELTKRFPHILFEGCSSGGNRFDLGMLSYFPQIWASDNTDAFCRVTTQQGYSYGYPMSTVTAHVSACPNHQTMRVTPLETRFNVAVFGVFGYECNFCEMNKEELEAVKNQIALYKEWREVLQYGDFYRGETRDSNRVSWTCVARNQKKAVGMLFQNMVIPNMPFERFLAKGLQPDLKYRFYHTELNYQEEAYGNTLMYGGVHLKKGLCAEAPDGNPGPCRDFASKIYMMEEAK